MRLILMITVFLFASYTFAVDGNLGVATGIVVANTDGSADAPKIEPKGFWEDILDKLFGGRQPKPKPLEPFTGKGRSEQVDEAPVERPWDSLTRQDIRPFGREKGPGHLTETGPGHSIGFEPDWSLIEQAGDVLLSEQTKIIVAASATATLFMQIMNFAAKRAVPALAVMPPALIRDYMRAFDNEPGAPNQYVIPKHASITVDDLREFYTFSKTRQSEILSEDREFSSYFNKVIESIESQKVGNCLRDDHCA